ncbi:hypothetical protein ATG_16250 [Desulfurococcaceae archaeon AG1]|nr:MAG: DNA-directed RNA polymerase subunit M [Desulfurococcaceae archaeon]GAY26421.1 hypothetical protein ATG_16250 [Desulfurococcaceae archaeon AG1]
MEFCPKCGGIMMPSRKGDSVSLKCSKCGYEKKASEDMLRGYTITRETDRSLRVKTTSRISESRGTSRSIEELEQEKEEYYEIFLDLVEKEEEPEQPEE